MTGRPVAGPYSTVDMNTGGQRRFDTLSEARAYAHEQWSFFERSTAICDGGGGLVDCIPHDALTPDAAA